MGSWVAVAIFGIAVTSAYRLEDVVISKMDDGLRYQHVQGPDGLYLEDMWLKFSDQLRSDDYDAVRDNGYHLFTRSNPQVSQPLVLGDESTLSSSNFDPKKRTVFLVHGWRNVPTSEFNTVLVPAFLEADDVNVILVDWSVGAAANYIVAILNVIKSGEAVADYIKWLTEASGSNVSLYHLVGHSLGGHQVGIIGRHLDGNVPYITALDPASPGWNTNLFRFRSTDGIFTEVIHTNAGVQGILNDIGDMDFYPNGGVWMPGCDNDSRCSHHRCVHYMAESVKTGGFTSTRCNNFLEAVNESCDSEETAQMGGLYPKTGRTGVFHLQTNAESPFSQG